MAGGGLYDPLGTDRPPGAPRAGPSFLLIALLVVLIGFASLFATAAFHDGGERGEPRAVAEIGQARRSDPAPLPSPPLGSVSSALPASLTGGSVPSSDQEVEIQNGVRVIRLHHNGSTAGSLVVKVPDPAAAAAATPLADPRLLENGSSGPLPQVGADGRRAAEAYAGAAVSGSTGKPWVSIVVVGLESDPTGTSPTSSGWPVAVTLGFGVDGNDLPRQVASARAGGHEVVLMLPPRKGGASEAVVSSVKGLSAPLPRDGLDWLLSRFTGYAGVVLDSANQDIASVAADILEVARRGLYVVDDAPANPTVSTPAIQDAALPMTHADLVLAGQAKAEAPEGFADRLVTLAHANGSAIGIMPASPRSFAALSRLTATLADSGVALVPLSAVVSLRRSAQARPIPVAVP